MSIPLTASSALNAQARDSKTSSAASRFLCFGGFQLDTQRELLFKDGAKVRLPGKVFQTLVALLEKPGEVVTREALRERLWPEGTFVNYDANVNTTVNKLRQALGESTEKPSYIETIPRKGYSFIGTAEFSDVPFSPAGQNQPTGTSTSKTGVPGTDGMHEKKRISLLILLLILAGMLIGAGAATYWISRFAPQLKHSASRHAPPASSQP